MRSRAWVVLALGLLAASPAAAERWGTLEHLPGAATATLLVSDKERVYFRVTAAKPLEFAITGPAQVRITTRVEMPAGSPAVATYQLKVFEGVRMVDQIATESSVADSVRTAGSAMRFGKSRTLTFDLPAGKHALKLALAGAAAVVVRIQQSGGASDVPMISLTPVSAARSVSVAEGEKTIPYYTVLPRRPVMLRVVGPTTLEILSRLDFDETMRGTFSYTLRASAKGRTLTEAQFKTTKATTATYTNLPDRVPSKFDRMIVAVPGGLHEISLQLIQPARGSAEIHARIPQPSVGNQE
jgi:hypothetical protein